MGTLSCVRRPVTASVNLEVNTGQTGSHQSSPCGGKQSLWGLRGTWALSEGPSEDTTDGSSTVPTRSCAKLAERSMCPAELQRFRQ